MKRKLLSLIAVMAASAAVFTGCLDSGKSSSAGTTASEETTASEPFTNDEGEELSESMELMYVKFRDVPALESGPVIKISDTTAKPGEIAEVTVSLTGADNQWNMCGIHITYPDVLECQLSNAEELYALYEPGDAVRNNAGFVAMDWEDNLAPEMVREHNKSLFFTTMFMDTKGHDGDIATFYFKVPDDAQPGTVYKLSYYYMDSDMFRDEQSDMSFEKYAFEHLQDGSITIR